MKLKIRYNAIILIILILVYIAQNKWLYIIDIPINRVYIQLSFIFIGLVLVYKKEKIVYRDKIIIDWMLIFYALYSVQTVISTFRYEQDIVDTFMSESYYFIMLSYFLLVVYMHTEKDKQKLEEIICKIGIIVGLILIIHVYVLIPNGIHIFRINYGHRMDTIRVITSMQIIEISTILGFALFINRLIAFKTRLLGLTATFIGMICSIFIGMTRMSIMILALSLSLMYLMATRGYEIKSLLKKIGSVLVVIFLFNFAINSELFARFVNEFSINGSNTFLIRTYEIQYALNSLSRDTISILFGTGFVTSDNTKYLYVINGQNSFFGRTDIGVLGFAHEFGIVGLVMVLLLTVLLIIRFIKTRKNGIMALDYLGLLSYYILGMATLFMMNIERITYFPILLAISSFYVKMEEMK